jgi:5'-3' exonuclease
MGVRGLQSFVKQYSVSRTLDYLLSKKNSKLRIGIDVSYYIYRWMGDVNKILAFLQALHENRHHVILVFDGRAEDGKIWEAQRRREVREQELKSANLILDMLSTEGGDLSEEQRFLLEKKAIEHQKKGWSLTRELRHSIKETLYVNKIPMIKAKGEADGLLAAMSAKGELDLVISGDMDLLAMGTKILWTPTEDGVHFREFDREKILLELGLSDWQFRSLCAMCFTEASQEQNKFNIQQAYQLLKVFKSLTVLKQKYPEWLTVWPDESHIFYRSVETVEPWLREDQLAIYKAYMNYEPMPYS